MIPLFTQGLDLLERVIPTPPEMIKVTFIMCNLPRESYGICMSCIFASWTRESEYQDKIPEREVC